MTRVGEELQTAPATCAALVVVAVGAGPTSGSCGSGIDGSDGIAGSGRLGVCGSGAFGRVGSCGRLGTETCGRLGSPGRLGAGGTGTDGGGGSWGTLGTPVGGKHTLSPVTGTVVQVWSAVWAARAWAPNGAPARSSPPSTAASFRTIGPVEPLCPI